MPHKDPAERRAYKQAYHAKNRDRHLATMKAWYANNREVVRAYQQARRETRRREDAAGLKKTSGIME